MEPNLTTLHAQDGRWRHIVVMTCCSAGLFVLAAIALVGLPMWFRGGLSLVGLVLLGIAGGQLVAHGILDQRPAGPTGRNR
jgi:hypothetical protein